MKNIICFDNNRETFDRFTILNKDTGEMLGSSENPFHPLGFGQYVGNVAHNYWVAAYGYGWKEGCNKSLLNKKIKFAVDLFLNDCGHIGKIVDFYTLPIDVQKFVKNNLS